MPGKKKPRLENSIRGGMRWFKLSLRTIAKIAASRKTEKAEMSQLTPPEHEHSAAIDQAVAWLRETPRHMRQAPVVKELRERFGLTPVEACAALREFDLIRVRAL